MAVRAMDRAHYFGHVIEVQIATHQEKPFYLLKAQNSKRRAKSKKVKSLPSSNYRQNEMEQAPPAPTSAPTSENYVQEELAYWQPCNRPTTAAALFTTQQLMIQFDQELAELHQLARRIQLKFQQTNQHETK